MKGQERNESKLQRRTKIALKSNKSLHYERLEVKNTPRHNFSFGSLAFPAFNRSRIIFKSASHSLF